MAVMTGLLGLFFWKMIIFLVFWYTFCVAAFYFGVHLVDTVEANAPKEVKNAEGQVVVDEA